MLSVAVRPASSAAARKRCSDLRPGRTLCRPAAATWPTGSSPKTARSSRGTRTTGRSPSSTLCPIARACRSRWGAMWDVRREAGVQTSTLAGVVASALRAEAGGGAAPLWGQPSAQRRSAPFPQRPTRDANRQVWLSRADWNPVCRRTRVRVQISARVSLETQTGQRRLSSGAAGEARSPSIWRSEWRASRWTRSQTSRALAACCSAASAE